MGLSLEYMQAVGALAAAILGHVLSDMRHRRREHSRLIQAEREREKRATSVTLVVDDRVEAIIDKKISGLNEAIETRVEASLRGFRSSMDKRMSDFERHQNEMRGALAEALRNSDRDRMALLTLEKERMDEQRHLRSLLVEMQKLQVQQGEVLKKILDWMNG